MILNGPLMWIFMGFDLTLQTNQEGRHFQVSEIGIPRLTVPGSLRLRPTQAFTMDMEGIAQLEEFSVRVTPAPKDDLTWVEFVKDSLGFRVDRPKTTLEDDLKHIASRAFFFENPKLTNPGTLDCVSCHAAQTTRLWSQKNVPQLGYTWDWLGGFKQVQYESPHNLENRSVRPLQTNRLRGFGYFEDEPQISQRVINETAEVLDLLNGAP
ncbi:MAG: hypothetical protein RBT63_02910 [Bdellovibrionales bacterium]|nr:hypothetical protein [Bdellovibrionales bacterium]